ncbi:acyltransferase family protein [Roseateles sp. DB2]|uniref:acyltransferase family protein n=1 Tax=Roseateles sp. DB2 TaxID=3453717 RepID=UPI003EEE611D
MNGEIRGSRLHSLDILRGLCALGVCVYHYCRWSDVSIGEQLQGVLGLIGTYGVSIFFVLSGYSLAFAYERKFSAGIDRDSLLAYLRRRIGRLAPLFILTVLASILGKLAVGRPIPLPHDVVLNLTLLFGFVDPANTPVIGGWSIGVEVVLYLLFPVALGLGSWIWALFLASALIAVSYALALSPFPSLADGWRTYVQPANHAVFFLGGILIYRLSRQGARLGNMTALLLLVCSGIVLVFASLGASELSLVTGWRRLILTAFSLGLVAAWAQLDIPDAAATVASLMGGASYPIYLLHPLIYFAVKGRMDSAAAIGVTAAMVAGLAILVDMYGERPMQRRLKAVGW